MILFMNLARNIKSIKEFLLDTVFLKYIPQHLILIKGNLHGFLLKNGVMILKVERES